MPAPAAAVENGPKEWKMEDLAAAVGDLGPGRNFIQGGRAFQQACSVCHAFSNYWQGTGLAPDLTSVGTKFSRESILESIIEPSATINGQYYNTRFKMKSGEVVEGVVVDEEDGRIIVAPSVAAPQSTLTLDAANVDSREPSTVSPMIAGMINSFTREQVLDLMAFLVSGGNQDAPVYRK